MRLSMPKQLACGIAICLTCLVAVSRSFGPLRVDESIIRAVELLRKRCVNHAPFAFVTDCICPIAAVPPIIVINWAWGGRAGVSSACMSVW